MIKNIGVDITQNNRFTEYISNEKKRNRILSVHEEEEYLKINNDERKLEYIASRFCAKEALIKAINKEQKSFSYRDISVLNESNGAPMFQLSFELDGSLHLSISHENDYSIAFVIYDK